MMPECLKTLNPCEKQISQLIDAFLYNCKVQHVLKQSYIHLRNIADDEKCNFQPQDDKRQKNVQKCTQKR